MSTGEKIPFSKDTILSICREFIETKDGWEYHKREFRRAITKGFTTHIAMDWSFNSAVALAQPLVYVRSERVLKIYKKIFGEDPLGVASNRLQRLDPYLNSITFVSWKTEATRDSWMLLDKLPETLERVFLFGSSKLRSAYDLSSERAMLCSVPFIPRHARMYCLIQAIIGNGGYLDFYLSDNFQSKFKKDIEGVQKIKDFQGELPQI